MQEHVKGQRDEQRQQDNQREGAAPNDPANDGLTGGISRDINQVNDDLDEKTSTAGRTNRGRSSGISTKDGLTGSDYDGQVTNR